jgi:hypothetical protein
MKSAETQTTQTQTTQTQTQTRVLLTPAEGETRRCDGCWAGSLESEGSCATASLFDLPYTPEEGEVGRGEGLSAS